jgi:hypothetical protein
MFRLLRPPKKYQDEGGEDYVADFAPEGDEPWLMARISAGKAARFKEEARGKIRAEFLRRLILGLSLGDDCECRLPPTGIVIVNADIAGRVELDRVITASGGPVGALEFRNCFLAEGFSGAHGHFSRLSFVGCRFGDPIARETECAPATVELSGAEIGSDLDMEGVYPNGFDPKSDHPAPTAQHLWIRLAGARIDGKIDLCGCRLRALPKPADRPPEEDPPDALDFSLAVVAGDFQFRRGSRAIGRIKGRSSHFKGDMWLSGAFLDGAGGQSLMLQSATIDGFLMLDSRSDDAAGQGAFRWFHSIGEINLLQLKLGGRLVMKNAKIEGSADVRPSRPPPGPQAGSASPSKLCLCLTSAHIGGSVEITCDSDRESRLEGQLLLRHLHVETELQIKNVCLGNVRDAPVDQVTIDGTSMTAGMLSIEGVKPFSFGGTASWVEPDQPTLSADFSDATVGRFEIRRSRFTGDLKAVSLRCTGEAVLDCRVGGAVDLEGAEIGRSLDISGLRMDPSAPFLSLNDGKIGQALRLSRRTKPGDPLPVLVRAQQKTLTSLPDTVLIETLWRFATTGNKTTYRQAAFLERKGVHHLLDRRSDTIGDFVKLHGHCVHDVEAAVEYFTLFCDYGPTERKLRWLIDRRDAIPFATVHPVQDEMKVVRSPRPPASSQSVPKRLEDMPPSEFAIDRKLVASSQGKWGFEIGARLLSDDCLVRGRFGVAAGRGVLVRALSEPERPVRLANVPAAEGQFLLHPAVAASQASWIMPPALGADEEMAGEALFRLSGRLRPLLSSGFATYKQVDLENLSCTTLDDQGGRLWGDTAQINMDRFVYRQAVGEAEGERRRRPTGARFLDWLSRLVAEWLWPNWLRLPEGLRHRSISWEPWEIRRNWIYRQFSGLERLPAVSRRQIATYEYRAQPFEQAVRVARAEGREDVAIEFEILKRRIEWRQFNRRTRWWLGALAILVSAVWLINNGGSRWATPTVLVITWTLMAWVSSTHDALGRWLPWMPSGARWLLTNFLFWVPALLLLAFDWFDKPFHWLVGGALFLVIRLLSFFAEKLMRFGFGYLRRPVRAIGTLVAAFVIGWWGVNEANSRHMLVIDAEPVAPLAGPDPHAYWRHGARDGSKDEAAGGPDKGAKPDGQKPTLLGMEGLPVDPTKDSRKEVKPILLMGSATSNDEQGFQRDLPCAPMVSEPLYALDVLIPLVDLREESRCEVRRVPEAHFEPIEPEKLGWSALWKALPQMTLDNHRFWWWIKALYAIAGWIIVSLALLTFAQVNRTPGEIPEG